MDEGNFLSVERVIGDISIKPLDVVHSARVGQNFEIEIDVVNSGPHTLSWDQKNPINISYRWFDMATGMPLVLDGPRAVFSDVLHPYSMQKLRLVVTAPSFCGMATLRISGVCEGRYWFYEQFETGWADLGIKIVDPYPWPAELKGGIAGRALRGGVAASALRASLTAAPIHCLTPLPSEKSTPEQIAPSADEETESGFKLFPGPVEALSAGPLDACPPSSWRSSFGIMTVTNVGGWRSWLRHPFAALKRHLNNALARSSLGQRLEVSQRAMEEVLERLRQIAENEMHTQFMLRQMAGHYDRRDAFYAKNKHAHLDLLQRELGRFYQEKIGHLGKIVADGVQANEAARLEILKHQQVLLGLLQSVVDVSRRLQLGQLRSDEDLKQMQARQAGMAGEFEAAGQRQLAALSELREAFLVHASDASKVLQARLADHEKAFSSVMADMNGATIASLDSMQATLETRFDEHEMVINQAFAALPPLKDAIIASVGAAHRALDARLNDHEVKLGDAITDLAVRYEKGDEQIRAALSDLEAGGNKYAVDLEHLTGDFASLRDFLQVNLAYMFAKVDALLHRQVFPATSSGKIICRNAKGLFAIPERDMEALSYYTAGQLPESGSLAVVERLLQPGDTFVDVGANVGLFSVVAGRRVGHRGKILSFEPEPETMSALAATVQLNGLGGIVSLHQSAAGRQTGTATLYLGQTCGHSSLLPLDESREAIEVPVIALDEVIGDQKVALIKIDVEGWELEVLQGLGNTLANNPQASVLLEFGPSHLRRAGTDLSTWISALQALGMTLFEIDEERASVTPLRSEGLEHILSINLLLSRRPETHLNQG